MYSVVLLAALSTTEQAPAHGWMKHHCYGACYGACYGNGYAGWPHAYGGWGLPYGGYWGGYGCYMPHGGPAFGLHSPAFSPAPATYATDEAKPEKKDEPAKDKMEPKKKDKDGTDNKSQARARLVFEMPRGAALYVDGQLIDRPDERKAFQTPPLKRGEQYYYELRVEVLRDGRKFVENKKVTLAAGETVRADFSTVGTTSGVATAEAGR